MRQLQCLCVLDQNAVLRGHASARHDGRRGGQPQGAGAGDDQHGHRVDNSGLKRVAGQPPAQKRQQGQHQHHRHKHGADLVHQPLDRCLGGLGVFHQPDDAGQHRVHSHGGHLQHHAAVAVDGAAGKLVARVLAHGQRFAGQHRLVDLGLPLCQCAVHRKTFAGFDGNAVAHHHIGHGYIDLPIAPQPVGHVRAQRMQGADGGRGLAFGACLQPFAQQHQRDDHGRAFEVQVDHRPIGRGQPQPYRQGPTSGGANGHQQVHIAAARQQGMPACLVKARTEDELHGGGQQKLQPRRQHPVLSEEVAHHRQRQRCRQQRADGDRAKAGPGRHGFERVDLCRGAHLVTRIAHGAAQAGWHLVGICIGNARRLGGQVDGGVQHARHFFQGFFNTTHTGGTGHSAHGNVQAEVGGRGGSRGVHGVEPKPSHHGKVKCLRQISQVA